MIFMKNRILRLGVIIFLLALTFLLEIYLLFWQKIHKFKIFPGS
jgi:hypothetical protein